MTFFARLRAYFFAGVLVTAPIGITLYLTWLIIDFIDGQVTPLIPERYNPESYLPFTVRSEEHTSELPSLMRIPYALFCLTTTKPRTTDTLQSHRPTPPNHNNNHQNNN